jgi:hypothetical protein
MSTNDIVVNTRAVQLLLLFVIDYKCKGAMKCWPKHRGHPLSVFSLQGAEGPTRIVIFLQLALTQSLPIRYVVVNVKILIIVLCMYTKNSCNSGM